MAIVSAVILVAAIVTSIVRRNAISRAVEEDEITAIETNSPDVTDIQIKETETPKPTEDTNKGITGYWYSDAPIMETLTIHPNGSYTTTAWGGIPGNCVEQENGTAIMTDRGGNERTATLIQNGEEFILLTETNDERLPKTFYRTEARSREAYTESLHENSEYQEYIKEVVYDLLTENVWNYISGGTLIFTDTEYELVLYEFNKIPGEEIPREEQYGTYEVISAIPTADEYGNLKYVDIRMSVTPNGSYSRTEEINLRISDSDSLSFATHIFQTSRIEYYMIEFDIYPEVPTLIFSRHSAEYIMLESEMNRILASGRWRSAVGQKGIIITITDRGVGYYLIKKEAINTENGNTVNVAYSSQISTPRIGGFSVDIEVTAPGYFAESSITIEPTTDGYKLTTDMFEPNGVYYTTYEEMG
ncbi:MAG: hypothetical protein FWG88_00625 [Oscillospiraceae bacterium]|nr:hypothetical protein [Oscillospiraceae bacterium]